MHVVTMSVCPLRFYRKYDDGGNAGQVADATGILWRENDRWYLVTNWHNLSGVNPLTGSYLGGFTPTHVQIGIKVLLRQEGNTKWMLPQQLEAALYRDDNPLWIEHPRGHQVDCVALPVEIPDQVSLETVPFNEIGFATEYQPEVGDECFVIGFPKGLKGKADTPIWKRASIATEPKLDHDGFPMFLVDTAGRKGMSGSPVTARIHSLGFKPGSMQSRLGVVENFVGIYSGRTDDDELGVQIGRVWRSEVITEIVLANKLGRNPLDLGPADFGRA